MVLMLITRVNILRKKQNLRVSIVWMRYDALIKSQGISWSCLTYKTKLFQKQKFTLNIIVEPYYRYSYLTLNWKVF